MKEQINEIIVAVLTGKDHRPFVLKTINKRFLDAVFGILAEIIQARQRDPTASWWQNVLLSPEKEKIKILWYGGLNQKTVTNMANTSRKEACLRLSKENVKVLQRLATEIIRQNTVPSIKTVIRLGRNKITLDERESLNLLNTIASMKLTIQGGAWSEVGKKTEKKLLYTIFTLLGVPENQFIIVMEEMKRKGFVKNREIDCILIADDKKKRYNVEVKLLGIGNPEIGDEALAREISLFLTDRLTPMMIEEARKRGIVVVEFRQENSLEEIHKYLVSKKITSVYKPLTPPMLQKLILRIANKYDEDLEEGKISQTIKQLSLRP